MSNFEQPRLPMEIRDTQYVSWYAVTVRKKRFGKQIVTAAHDENGRSKEVTISVDDIGKLEDPNLRYALSFADAANAAKVSRADKNACLPHGVGVFATDEAEQSRLVRANYTGIDDNGVDTFIRFLESSADIAVND